MVKKYCFVCLLALIMVSTFGCFYSPLPTREQLEAQQRILEHLRNRSPYNQTASQSTQQKEPLISEEELAKKIDSMPKINQPLVFLQKKDGFDVNGVRYIDAEGPIVNYAYDSITGDVTYLIESGQDNYIIKSVRVLTNIDAIKIATAIKDASSHWKVETVTGKKLMGDGLAMLNRGFIVARQTTGFLYTPGNGIINFAAPDQFNIANFQHGEVLQSRYILVERDRAAEDGLMSSVKSLGAAFGVNKKEDYALVNIDSGQQVLLNMDVSGKEVATHSDCRKMKNAPVNKCARVDFYDSLYQDNGLPNAEHYYWRLAWFNSETGPLVIVREGSKVYIKNLKENKMVVAFERSLGINSMVASRNADGKIVIDAQLGFSNKKIDDAEKFYNDNAGTAVAIQ